MTVNELILIQHLTTHQSCARWLREKEKNKIKSNKTQPKSSTVQGSSVHKITNLIFNHPWLLFYILAGGDVRGKAPPIPVGNVLLQSLVKLPFLFCQTRSGILHPSPEDRQTSCNSSWGGGVGGVCVQSQNHSWAGAGGGAAQPKLRAVWRVTSKWVQGCSGSVCPFRK